MLSLTTAAKFPPLFDGSGPNLALKNRVKIMAVKMRLKRVGMKNTPVFRIVATDGRKPRDGRPKEELGTYSPLSKEDPNFTINLERAEYWLGVGAMPSDTVRSFIRKARRAAKASA